MLAADKIPPGSHIQNYYTTISRIVGPLGKLSPKARSSKPAKRQLYSFKFANHIISSLKKILKQTLNLVFMGMGKVKGYCLNVGKISTSECCTYSERQLGSPFTAANHCAGKRIPEKQIPVYVLSFHFQMLIPVYVAGKLRKEDRHTSLQIEKKFLLFPPLCTFLPEVSHLRRSQPRD